MRAELSYLLHLSARFFYIHTIYEPALPASKTALFGPFRLKITLPPISDALRPEFVYFRLSQTHTLWR